MRGRMARRALQLAPSGMVVVLGLLAAPTAEANHGPAPWVGGTSLVSSFEARTSAIANEWIAAVSPYKRPVFTYCAFPEEWSAFIQQRGGDPDAIWGFTLFDGYLQPYNFAALSPQACSYGDEFLSNPSGGRKTCQVGAQTVYDTVTRTVWKTKTVKRRVRGKILRRRVTYRVTVAERVPRAEPVYGACPNWRLTVLAVHTLQHELQHLTGFADEALADCMAIQTNAWMAYKLSGDGQLAVDLANEAWAMYQAGIAGYPDARCYDGGPWDVAPEDPSWPVPSTSAYMLARAASSLRDEYFVDQEPAGGPPAGGPRGLSSVQGVAVSRWSSRSKRSLLRSAGGLADQGTETTDIAETRSRGLLLRACYRMPVQGARRSAYSLQSHRRRGGETGDTRPT